MRKLSDLDSYERLEVEYIKAMVGDGTVAQRMSAAANATDPFESLGSYRKELDKIVNAIKKQDISDPAEVEKIAIQALYPFED